MSLVALLAQLIVPAGAMAATPPPPPVLGAATAQHGVTIGDQASAKASIVDYVAGDVRCEGVTVAPVFVAEPLPIAVILVEGQAPPTYTVAFELSREGRPISIAEPVRAANSFVYLDVSDLAPSLAASRFAAGSDRRGCRVTYTPRMVPIATAPREALYRFAALPTATQFGKREAWDRIFAMSGDCAPTRRQPPLVAVRPDFARIPQRPGTMSWVMTGFDIDRSGKPVRVRTLASAGNAVLDRASADAMARSRFVAGPARHGCAYSFHRIQTSPIAPPDVPPPGVPSAAACEGRGLINLPPLRFPAAFRRRAIEGFATVQYDIAPWGGTGNIKVLSAQPAAQFGSAAQAIVAQAKAAPSSAGASGCIQRVRFAMATKDADAAPLD